MDRSYTQRSWWSKIRWLVMETVAYCREWVILIAKAVRATLATESSLSAAAISYFTLFSLFPLTLMTVAVASLWLDPMLAESEIVTQLEFAAPALGELLGANIERIVRARGPVTGLAVLTLIWSASNIFNVITRAMDRIWNVDQSRSVWRHRGLAILTALIISGLLLAAMFAQGTVLTIVNSLLPEEMATMRPFTDLFWSLTASIVLFSALYYYLPHRTLRWREVFPGAVFAGFLWEFAKRGFLNFIASYLSRSNLVYGSVATITAFLTWSYLSSLIFLFGAYLNVGYAQALEAGFKNRFAAASGAPPPTAAEK